MNKKQLSIYQENLKFMNIESLRSIANNGLIYMLSDNQKKMDLISACKIERIRLYPYEEHDLKKSESPVFFTIATFNYHDFFVIYNTDYKNVLNQLTNIMKLAISSINELLIFKTQMEIILPRLCNTDIAYNFPRNYLCYEYDPDFVPESPEIIPYPDDYPILY